MRFKFVLVVFILGFVFASLFFMPNVLSLACDASIPECINTGNDIYCYNGHCDKDLDNYLEGNNNPNCFGRNCPVCLSYSYKSSTGVTYYECKYDDDCEDKEFSSDDCSFEWCGMMLPSLEECTSCVNPGIQGEKFFYYPLPPCSDNRDNDCDSLTDCKDSDCEGSSECKDCTGEINGVACKLPTDTGDEKNGFCKDGNCLEKNCENVYGIDGFFQCPVGVEGKENCCKKGGQCCQKDKKAKSVCCKSEPMEECDDAGWFPKKVGVHINKCKTNICSNPESPQKCGDTFCCKPKPEEICSYQEKIISTPIGEFELKFPTCTKSSCDETKGETLCAEASEGKLCCQSNQVCKKIKDIGSCPVKECGEGESYPNCGCDETKGETFCKGEELIETDDGSMYYNACCGKGTVCFLNPNGRPRCVSVSTEINAQINSNTNNVKRNQKYTINAEITCKGSCKNVKAYLHYGVYKTTSLQGLYSFFLSLFKLESTGFILIEKEGNPFMTPENPKSCGDMGDGGKCYLSWEIGVYRKAEIKSYINYIVVDSANQIAKSNDVRINIVK